MCLVRIGTVIGKYCWNLVSKKSPGCPFSLLCMSMTAFDVMGSGSKAGFVKYHFLQKMECNSLATAWSSSRGLKREECRSVGTTLPSQCVGASVSDHLCMLAPLHADWLMLC